MHPGVFPPTSLSQCLPLSGPTFRVLTIGGIPLSRYSVSQRQCGLCCSQWSWRVTEGGERKGMIVRARYSVLPLLVKRPFPGEGTEGRTVVCKPPFERGSWGMFKGWKVVDFFGGHRVCGLIEKRCFEECVVCWSFSPDSTHLSFRNFFEKIFLFFVFTFSFETLLWHLCCVLLRFESGKWIKFS